MSDEPFPRLLLDDLLRSLDAIGVEYLVFGAAAAALYGHVRATEDLDVIVRPTAENRDRIRRWFLRVDARLGRPPHRALAERDFRALGFGRNAFVQTRFGLVDLVQNISGLPPWDELSARAVEFDLGDLTVRAVDRQTLIDCKRARGNGQDLLDIEQLEALDD